MHQIVLVATLFKDAQHIKEKSKYTSLDSILLSKNSHACLELIRC